MINSAPSTTRRPTRANRAFTIVELLVSMAIIFVLITTAFYALRTAKRAANNAQSLNSLRQLAIAHGNYTNDNGGRFMPGYVDPSLIDTNTDPTDDSNFLIKPARDRARQNLTAEASASWVWRLAPYLEHDWKVALDDYRDSSLLELYDGEIASGNHVTVAEFPAFGLNSIFIGGDTRHAGLGINSGTNLCPWVLQNGAPQTNVDRIAATRMSEIKNTSRVILFAPTANVRTADNPLVFISGTGSVFGSAEVRPPYVEFDALADGGKGDWTARQWEIDSTSTTLMASGGTDYDRGGFPFDRSGRSDLNVQLSPSPGDDGYRRAGVDVPVAHLDGSTGTFNPLSTMFDVSQGGSAAAARRNLMARWSPFAISTR